MRLSRVFNGPKIKVCCDSLVFFCLLASLVITAGASLYFWLTLPEQKNFSECFITNMHKVFVCKDNDTYTPLSEISEAVVQAIVISEDASFFTHKGLDWDEIEKSFHTNISEGRFKRGASTISQQLVKNIYLSGEKTILRKLHEIYLTINLEKTHSKEVILEKYLNMIEFGPSIYGIKNASQYYFAKLPEDINYLEAVYLAFLLPSPKKYHRYFAERELTPFAEKSLHTLLGKLHKYKRIDETEYNDYLARLSQFPWRD